MQFKRVLISCLEDWCWRELGPCSFPSWLRHCTTILLFCKITLVFVSS